MKLHSYVYSDLLGGDQSYFSLDEGVVSPPGFPPMENTDSQPHPHQSERVRCRVLVVCSHVSLSGLAAQEQPLRETGKPEEWGQGHTEAQVR